MSKFRVVFATINQSTVSRLAGPGALIELVLAARGEVVRCGVHALDEVRRHGPPGVRAVWAHTHSRPSGLEWNPFTVHALPLREGMRAAVETLAIRAVPPLDPAALATIFPRLAATLVELERRTEVRLVAGRLQRVATHRAHFPALEGTTAYGARLTRHDRRALLDGLVRMGREAGRIAGSAARARLGRVLAALRRAQRGVALDAEDCYSYTDMAQIAHRAFCELASPLVPQLESRALLWFSGELFARAPVSGNPDWPVALFDHWLKAPAATAPWPFYLVLDGRRFPINGIDQQGRLQLGSPAGAPPIPPLNGVKDTASFWEALGHSLAEVGHGIPPAAALAPRKLGLILALRALPDARLALVGPVLTYRGEAEAFAMSLRSRLVEQGLTHRADEVARAHARPFAQVVIPTLEILERLDEQHSLRLPPSLAWYVGRSTVAARELPALLKSGDARWRPIHPGRDLDDADEAEALLRRVAERLGPDDRTLADAIDEAVRARAAGRPGLDPAIAAGLVRELDRLVGAPAHALATRMLPGLAVYAKYLRDPARRAGIEGRLSAAERARLVEDERACSSLTDAELQSSQSRAALVGAIFGEGHARLAALFAAARAGLLARSVLEFADDPDVAPMAETSGEIASLAAMVHPAAAALKRELRDAPRADGRDYHDYVERRLLDAWIVRAACCFELQIRSVEQTVKVMRELPPSLTLYLLFGLLFFEGAIEHAVVNEVTA